MDGDWADSSTRLVFIGRSASNYNCFFPILILPRPMGDILDLFLDFERKLLALLRDMVIRPAAVIESVQAKDKKYLGAFKFYSLVFSLWLVLLRLTNSWLRFYGEDWTLPQRLYEYSQSQVEFTFFMAPFI